MTEYIKREDAMDAVLDVYYNTPDIDLNGERLETAMLRRWCMGDGETMERS